MGVTVGSNQMKDAGPPKDSTPSENFPYGGLLLEFDSQETIQPHFSSAWWHAFGAAALEAGPPDPAAAAFGSGYYPSAISKVNQLLGVSPTVFSANAVVTGLMGIDGVHSGGISELHPVFSMALHLPGDESSPGELTEHWAFFIRNQGDEGNCSALIHTLEPEEEGARDYYISLPWPKGASSLRSISGSGTPWAISGAGAGQLGQTQVSPGVATQLHFLSPAYSGNEAPPFGFDGEVTLHYAYPPGKAPEKAQRDDPTAREVAAASTPASTPAEAQNNRDVEDFPWQAIIAEVADPAVKIHLQRYLKQRPPIQITRPLPEIRYVSDVSIVKPKTFSPDTTFRQRTRTTVNVAKLRQNDDLSLAAGYPQRTFQAIDSQRVFILGTDGILRLERGPFPTADGNASSSTSTEVDRGVQTFDAVSDSEVLVLRRDGALFVENAPFGGPLGTCVQGFVWRQADPDDHVCVTPSTRTQVALDNASGPSRIAPALVWRPQGTCVQGFVWRQADAKDRTCVSSSTRKQTAADNAYGPYRIAGDGSDECSRFGDIEIQGHF